MKKRMKKIVCVLASIGIILTLLSTENFVLPKKEITKKKPRVTDEHIVVGDGDLLEDSTMLIQKLAELNTSSLHNVRDTMSQKSNLCKEERSRYIECTQKMQNAMIECSRCIDEQQAIRKRCFKK